MISKKFFGMLFAFLLILSGCTNNNRGVTDNKVGYTIHDVEKVPKEKVFPYIFSKFKGKIILIDLWATWCGPCRAANIAMKPLKKEFADKGIVYVFVAGDNSPLEEWNNMIPDLHGEHFKLSAEQWSYIDMTFGIKGVPTYFLIDRKGNIREKFTGYPGNTRMEKNLLQLINE